MPSATAPTPIVVVAVDSDRRTLDLVSEALVDDNIKLFLSSNVADAVSFIQEHRPRIVLLGSENGSQRVGLLQDVLQLDPGLDIVVLTEAYSSDFAIKAIHDGASDCLPKPVSVQDLRDLVKGLVSATLARRRTLQLDRELMEAFRFEGMVGRSPLMLDLYSRITRVARHFKAVLISGPTGTGKELVARALHARSPVRDRPFVAVNCAAIAESLAESELFGHLKGSFTGASHDQVGLFEFASGGTVFLDEIGDMKPAMQAKLLRVIQNQEVTRVGSPVARKVDVRIIAATNCNLQELMKEKRFREDLFYRLSTVSFKLPSLADRKEDLPILQREFVDRAAKGCGKTIRGITRRAQAVLNRYWWPGNVRELENVVNHACMMAEVEFVDVHDLPEYIVAGLNGEVNSDEILTLDQMCRQYARSTVSRLGGNKVKAAEVLGISRATIYRLLSSDKPENAAGPVLPGADEPDGHRLPLS